MVECQLVSIHRGLFSPPFGWITFWVFSGRDPELKIIARGAMIASFIGVVVLVILGAIGTTMYAIPWGIPFD
jgi:hypothetical protein